MKKLLFLLLTCSLFSCNLKIASDRNQSNTPSIGIYLDETGLVDPPFEARLDTSLNSFINTFNAENHSSLYTKKRPGIKIILL